MRMSTSTKRRRTSVASSSTVDVGAQTSSGSPTSMVPGPSRRQSMYIDNGDCNKVCQHCRAFFWYDERVLASSTARQLRYNQCCKAGKVRLPHPREPHSSLIALLDQAEFLANIRAYNYMFSMTSFGGKVDDTINSGSAPYVFKVESQVYHWIGSLCPPPNERPRFLQMYIYDTANEISNRLRFFSDDIRPSLSTEIVILLQRILEIATSWLNFSKLQEICAIRLLCLPSRSVCTTLITLYAMISRAPVA
jgi:hypothetical protein